MLTGSSCWYCLRVTLGRVGRESVFLHTLHFRLALQSRKIQFSVRAPWVLSETCFHLPLADTFAFRPAPCRHLARCSLVDFLNRDKEKLRHRYAISPAAFMSVYLGKIVTWLSFALVHSDSRSNNAASWILNLRFSKHAPQDTTGTCVLW